MYTDRDIRTCLVPFLHATLGRALTCFLHYGVCGPHVDELAARVPALEAGGHGDQADQQQGGDVGPHPASKVLESYTECKVSC